MSETFYKTPRAPKRDLLELLYTLLVEVSSFRVQIGVASNWWDQENFISLDCYSNEIFGESLYREANTYSKLMKKKGFKLGFYETKDPRFQEIFYSYCRYRKAYPREHDYHDCHVILNLITTRRDTSAHEEIVSIKNKLKICFDQNKLYFSKYRVFFYALTNERDLSDGYRMVAPGCTRISLELTLVIAQLLDD